jgi:GNAT superfamily N-acetyltransferase
MYIDSKSVLYEVWTFDYYLLTHTDSTGNEQIVGFFSKEKRSWNDFNLACIFILPPWQKKGLGKILTELSYEISRQQGIIGGPERPISDVGHMGYMRLWGKKICKYLLESPITDTENGTGEANIRRISEATGVSPLDCIDFFETVQKEMPDGPKMLKMKSKKNGIISYFASDKMNFEYGDKSWICQWLRGTMGVNALVIDQENIRNWLARRKIDVNEVVVDPRYVTIEEKDLKKPS